MRNQVNENIAKFEEIYRAAIKAFDEQREFLRVNNMDDDLHECVKCALFSAANAGLLKIPNPCGTCGGLGGLFTGGGTWDGDCPDCKKEEKPLEMK